MKTIGMQTSRMSIHTVLEPMSTIEQCRKGTIQEKVGIQKGYESNFDINALHKKQHD